jgi:hypothetical protein
MAAVIPDPAGNLSQKGLFMAANLSSPKNLQRASGRKSLSADAGLCLRWLRRECHIRESAKALASCACITTQQSNQGQQGSANADALGRAYQQVVDKSIREGIARELSQVG